MEQSNIQCATVKNDEYNAQNDVDSAREHDNPEFGTLNCVENSKPWKSFPLGTSKSKAFRYAFIDGMYGRCAPNSTSYPSKASSSLPFFPFLLELSAKYWL